MLATFHRPENVDDAGQLAFTATRAVALPLPVVLPAPPPHRGRRSRRARLPARTACASSSRSRYGDFLALASECAFLISDSGGVQEEASVVKRPVIVVRSSTERPEVLGTFARLVRPGEPSPTMPPSGAPTCPGCTSSWPAPPARTATGRRPRGAWRRSSAWCAGDPGRRPGPDRAVARGGWPHGSAGRRGTPPRAGAAAAAAARDARRGPAAHRPVHRGRAAADPVAAGPPQRGPDRRPRRLVLAGGSALAGPERDGARRRAARCRRVCLRRLRARRRGLLGPCRDRPDAARGAAARPRLPHRVGLRAADAEQRHGRLPALRPRRGRARRQPVRRRAGRLPRRSAAALRQRHLHRRRRGEAAGVDRVRRRRGGRGRRRSRSAPFWSCGWSSSASRCSTWG